MNGKHRVLTAIAIVFAMVIANFFRDKHWDKVSAITIGFSATLIFIIALWKYKPASNTNSSIGLATSNQQEDSLQSVTTPKALFQPRNTSSRIVVSHEEARSAYHELMDITVCSADTSAYHKRIDVLQFPKKGNKNYSIDEDFSFFFMLNEFINQTCTHLWINLNWNAAVEDLRFYLTKAIGNSSYKVQLPELTAHPRNASILYGLNENKNSQLSTVFSDYIFALNRADLGICFLPTYADFTVFFVYPLKDEEKVSHLVYRTGLGLGPPSQLSV